MAVKFDRTERRVCDNRVNRMHPGPVTPYEIINRATGEAIQVDLCSGCRRPLLEIMGVGVPAATKKPATQPRGFGRLPYLRWKGDN